MLLICAQVPNWRAVDPVTHSLSGDKSWRRLLAVIDWHLEGKDYMDVYSSGDS